MKKIIVNSIKNFILAFVMLYTFNIILSNVDVFVPINVFTIVISTMLGPFGSMSLVALSFLIL